MGKFLSFLEGISGRFGGPQDYEHKDISQEVHRFRLVPDIQGRILLIRLR